MCNFSKFLINSLMNNSVWKYYSGLPTNIYDEFNFKSLNKKSYQDGDVQALKYNLWAVYIGTKNKKM